MKAYTPIVGMEIHVELKTKSKMFCACKNDPFHAPKPNMYTCPVCLGLPGALPVANKQAVEWTIMLGLALGSTIPLDSKFDRKNYFYPDLAKGYQISQYDQPLCIGGQISFTVTEDGRDVVKTVRIHRVHLEEDTGKLLHATIEGEKVSLIDFNRSGVPLVEIVTEPDIHSAEEAKQFLKKLHQIIRYLHISDANMDEGSMRLEPNISLQREGETALPKYKVEVKNINSFNFVKKAIDFEVKRHQEILDRGETPKQETRGWDEKKNVTLPQRSKEGAEDYRYFPDPDLPPMHWTQNYIDELKKKLPEMPDVRLKRFEKEFGLPLQDAQRLVDDKSRADYFEACVNFDKQVSAKTIANWLLNKNVDIEKVSPKELVEQIKQAKQIVQMDETQLSQILEHVITANAKAVTDYKSGKTGVIMFLVGMVMKELKGKGDAQQVQRTLVKILNVE